MLTAAAADALPLAGGVSAGAVLVPGAIDAVSRFVGDCGAPAAAGVCGEPLPSVPFEAAVEPLAAARVADVGIGLALVLATWGVGHVLRAASRPSGTLRPVVFASVVTGLLMLTVVNPLLWEYAGVAVTADHVTVRRYAAADQAVGLCDIERVSLETGAPFPVVSDDTTLVLWGRSGERVELPRFAPGSRQAAALILAQLARSCGTAR